MTSHEPLQGGRCEQPSFSGAESALTRLHNRVRSIPSWRLGTGCIVLVGVIALIEYRLGYERSLLVGYLLPVALATWFLGGWLGIGTAVLGVMIWLLTDIATSIPSVRFWNAAMGLLSYAAFTTLLAHCRMLVFELDEHVQKRTAELRREIMERKRLEREVAEVTERERRRLGQDLHDSICQHLTGTALVAEAVSEKLSLNFSSEAPRAIKVVRLLEEGIDLARNLARGCFSPDLDAEGLSVALQGLAADTQARANLRCELRCDRSVRVRDSAMATHLYRIAQEAVANAVKHSHAASISISLSASKNALSLTVIDDGTGVPEGADGGNGLGLRMMAHGAGLMGARLSVNRDSAIGGTIVRCDVPKSFESEDAG